MKLRRLVISVDELVGNEVSFSTANAGYLHRVLRLGPGDHVKVFDGERDYLVELSEVTRAQVRGRVIEEHTGTRDEGMEVILGFACIRPGPVEEILRHGTELGVSRFVPILSERANRKPEASKPRWRTIVASAASQCGRSLLPSVESPVSLATFLAEHPGPTTRILLSTASSAPPLLVVLERERPERIVLLVGPEGGFADSEKLEALRGGFLRASLGHCVLRAETAAVTAAGVVAAWNQAGTWKQESPQGEQTFAARDTV